MSSDRSPTADRPPPPHRPAAAVRRWAVPVLCGLLAAPLLGCQEPEGIRKYQVPREPRTRMLAAILPHGESTWFVRVSGPEAAVEEHREAFRAFVTSFEFPKKEKGEPPVAYTVPKGWTEVKDQPKGEFQRFATFQLPAKGTTLELTVLPLGREGDAGSVLANVNRWRGQLGLPPAEASELPEFTQKFNTKGGVAGTLVDMAGPGGGRPVASRRMPADHPPLGKGGGKAPPAPLTYKTQEGWEVAPLKPFSVATFRVGTGRRAADVTVSPAGGDLVENINRWRDQVSLPRQSEAQIKGELRELQAGPVKAAYVELVGTNIKTREPTTILGAIAPHEGITWFFKMTGPPDVVAGQKAAFESFVRSVRFEERKGGQ